MKKREIRTHQDRRMAKSLLKRTISVLLTMTIMVTGLPMGELAEIVPKIGKLDLFHGFEAVLPDFEGWDGFHGILFSDKNAMTAEAAEAAVNNDRSGTTVNITTKEQLIAYANGTLTVGENFIGYRPDDTLSIAISDAFELSSKDNYPGIGTSSAPFSGIVKFQNAVVNGDYGDMSKISLNGVPLFNYLSADAKNLDTNDQSIDFYLNVSDNSTAPVLANYVVGSTGTPQSLGVIINSNDKQNGGVMGELISGTADIKVTYEGNGTVSGTQSVGTVCGLMASNTTLYLSVNTLASVVSTTVDNAHAGGVVGEMNSGSTLNIKAMPESLTTRNISATGSNAYAGGLVGKCDGATVTFASGVTYTDSAANNITGNLGAGGVFGYYGVAAGDNVTLDSSVYTLSGTNALESSANGGLIGVLYSDGGNGNTSTITIDGGNYKVKTDGVGGGVVGQIYAKSNQGLGDTVIISDVTTDITGKSGISGGIIGKLGKDNAENIAYARVEGTNTISVMGVSGQMTGGIAAYITYSFLDIAGENTISGKMYGGVVSTCTNGSVIRLAGKLDLRTMDYYGSANLVNDRKDWSLIYALGSGSDYDEATKTGWSYYRPDDKTSRREDVNGWEQVVRLVKDTTGTTKTLEDAGVLTVNLDHTVTIASPPDDYNIANSADFAKIALNAQINDGGDAVTKYAIRATTAYKWDNMRKQNFTLTGDVDLKDTGIRGFNKDIDGQNAYNATFDGGGHKITVAIGEAYGYRGDTLAENVKGGDNGIPEQSTLI